MKTPQDSAEYRAKKRFFARMLTIFGRKPVLEALQDPSIKAHKLHLADTNQPSEILRSIQQWAEQKGVTEQRHSREALSRISKNRRQDQGVALDIVCEGFQDLEAFMAAMPEQFELLALDGVTNPQNLGMIVRSVCASPLTGLLLPEKGCAKLDALVIKASAGTLFRAPIIHCPNLAESLSKLAAQGARVYGLEAQGAIDIGQLQPPARSVYVLGNETTGLSQEVAQQCTDRLRIPMAKGVESLNVSAVATLLAFRSVLRPRLG